MHIKHLRAVIAARRNLDEANVEWNHASRMVQNQQYDKNGTYYCDGHIVTVPPRYTTGEVIIQAVELPYGDDGVDTEGTEPEGTE